MAPEVRSGPLFNAVQKLDRLIKCLAEIFLVMANACLALMLIGTAATIILRLFNVSFYWIWPWTMQFFVWMSFIGFFVVYRLGKDIAVDFLVIRLGPLAMSTARYGVPIMIIAIMTVILLQMPTILSSQVGVIDGVTTPWGELERYTLSIPLVISCFLILLNSILTIAKALVGLPEFEADASELGEP